MGVQDAPLPAAPAPAAQLEAPRARLVVIAQDGTPGRRYDLIHEQTDVGREEGEVLLPHDPYVSARHARVSTRAGRFFIRDLDSVNRVYLRLRGPEPLRHADLLLIGLEVLRFETVSDAERGLGPATERGTQLFGSPCSPRYARLSQRTMEGVTRNVYYLSQDETIIGRESGDIVFTNDAFMSRRHAAISRNPVDSTFTVTDLRSSNGTYLAIRGEVELDDGDYLRVGQHLFRFDVNPAR
jgi:pSer/pThr/pTyr-binding forkhead associated (FHA) protein